MQSVELGQVVQFEHFCTLPDGTLYEPDEIEFTITRTAGEVLYGPFKKSNADFLNPGIGHYILEFTFPVTATPGIYIAKWKKTSAYYDTSYEYDTFQVLESMPEPSATLDPPRLYGIMRDSTIYNMMGFGTTDRLFLIGHADGLTLNDPKQVVNMQEAINMLGANSESPLLRALLEAYNSGARDIWLVAAAPMNEYYPNLEDRFIPREEFGGLNFYERYSERLDTTYRFLFEWDYPEIVIPLEAPFYDAGGVDFLTPLAFFCAYSFEVTGSPKIGIMGTRIQEWTVQDLETMAQDPRIANLSDNVAAYGESFIVDNYGNTANLSDPAAANKFILLVEGEVTMTTPQMDNSYVTSAANVIASVLTTQPLDRGLVFKTLPNVVAPIGRDLTKEEIQMLSRAKINPLIRTQMGKRSIPYQTILASDNTLAQDGSDFWAITQMRLITKVMQGIKALGNKHIGSIGFPMFKSQVQDYLMALAKADVIRGFDFSAERDLVDLGKVLVNISLKPYISIREIYFAVEVGLGA